MSDFVSEYTKEQYHEDLETVTRYLTRVSYNSLNDSVADAAYQRIKESWSPKVEFTHVIPKWLDDKIYAYCLKHKMERHDFIIVAIKEKLEKGDNVG